MRQIFDKTSVDGLLIAKCLSILLVVANHAHIATGIHGGLNGLILVSGIMMAIFAFEGTTKDTLVTFGNFCKRLAIPSIILALIWAVAYQELNWSELFMFRNWITRTRLVSFPIWYPQVMIQMLLGLGIIFWIFDLTPKIVRHPKEVTGIVLMLSIAVCLLSYAFWDTAYLRDKLPHLLAWNFIFGWFYWASMTITKKALKTRILLSLILAVSSYLTFVYSGAIYGESRFVWLMIFGSIVIWVDEIKIPYFSAHILRLIGQATFYIFLWHYPSFGITLRLGKLLGIENVENYPILLFCSGVIYPLLLWVSVTAFKRAYINVREEASV